MESLKIICPNGHLGFAPLRPESFALGVAAGPDYIAADSGSDDVGPVPLGSDTSTSPEAWQRQDLEYMLLASRKLGVPMVIGSCAASALGASCAVTAAVQRRANAAACAERQANDESVLCMMKTCMSGIFAPTGANQ